MEAAGSPSKPWPVIGVVLSTAVIGFFLGGLVGRYVVSPSDGLAGAATVALAGMVTSVLLAVIAGVLFARRPRRDAVRALLVMGPVAVLLVAWTVHRIISATSAPIEQWQEEQQRLRRMKPTGVMFASWRPGEMDRPAITPSDHGSMGIGMVSPALFPRVLYFHYPPDLTTELDIPAVMDSIVFVQGPYHVEIASAPPWLVPAHLELDYDLLLFKAVTASQHWVEVEVNALDGRTAWMHRQDMQLQFWPEFILNVVAVETLDPSVNPIRSKPLDRAAVLAEGANALLKPIAIQGDWLMVGASELIEQEVPTGWIKWREGGKLLVAYSLLC